MHVLRRLNPNIAQITPYEPGRPIEDVAREHGLDPATICKLASNENPLGPSPKALRALRKNIRDVFRYPDGGAFYLREKLAQRHQVGRCQVIVGCGSNEILEFVGHCFLGPDRSIVVSAHAFVIYKLIAAMFQTRVIEVPTRGLGHDLTAMRRALAEDTSVLFVCNPNNPTGTLVRQAAVRRLMDNIPDSVLVVFDEAYAELALARMPDTLRYVREGRNCIVLRTFSKAYGLAGLRLGYGIGPEPLINALQKARQPFNASRPAQDAALAALDDDGYVRRSRRLFRQARAYLEERCTELGLDYEPTYANFLLIKVGNGGAVADALMRRGVIVRPMAGYGLPEYIRVSFGTMPENCRFVETLQAVLQTKPGQD